MNECLTTPQHKTKLAVVCETFGIFITYSRIYVVCFRSEEGGQHLSHAQTSPHRGASRDLQLGGNALHGV